MDLQEIQDKLNALLSGDGRKTVFWYDDDASYADEVDHFELAEGRIEIDFCPMQEGLIFLMGLPTSTI